MNETYIGYSVLLLVVITAVNAFFASSEAALLSVRQSKLRALAEEGHLGAQAALNLLSNTERLLSVVQVGVTLASLGMGWVGEQAVYNYLVGLVGPLGSPAAETALRGGSLVVSFLFLTLTLVVVGEVVPKNLAIERAEAFAVLVAPVLLIFYRIAEPFVFIVERSSAFCTRLLGVTGEPKGAGHSAEELQFIIRSSRLEGHLHPFEEGAIRRILELGNYVAREIMVPRNDVVSISAGATLDELLALMTANLYSRVPVYEGRPENIVGILHYRDLLRVWQERRWATEKRRSVRPFDMLQLVRKPLVIPETKPLDQLIDEFRAAHTHMALVVDEFGTIVGLLTFEDVLEQIFGEIEDEHDVKRQPPVLEATVLELEGAISIRDLETQYGIELPGDAGFETLAGFVLYQLGYIPQAGDAVEHAGRRFTIVQMDRNRIASVRIEKIAAPAEAS